MAISPEDRTKIWRGIMRLWSTFIDDIREDVSVLKQELMDAVDSTCDWLEANQASFNQALPAPARTKMTARQKAMLLTACTAMLVSPEFAKRLLGSMD